MGRVGAKMGEAAETAASPRRAVAGLERLMLKKRKTESDRSRADEASAVLIDCVFSESSQCFIIRTTDLPLEDHCY